jgi:hypothetical protein
VILNKKHLPIYIAAEDIRQGQIVCIDGEGRVRLATAQPVQEQRFPTLEELKNYATQGLSINQVARLYSLSSSEVVRDAVNQHPELKAQYLVNGKANRARKVTYERLIS